MLAEMKAILLQVAKCSPPIAGIIRHFGFRAQNKFGNFNAVEAAHAIVLHGTALIQDRLVLSFPLGLFFCHCDIQIFDNVLNISAD